MAGPTVFANAFAVGAGVGGCCSGSGPPPPPPCPITVNVSYRTETYTGVYGSVGAPIEGATVTLTGGSISASGTTDSSGNYTTPDFGSSDSATLTVTYGGCSYSTTVNAGDCNGINLCFCAFTTDLIVNGPGSATVVMQGISIGGDEFSLPISNGLSTPIGTATASGAGYTFSYCDLSLCSNALYFPTAVSFRVSAPGWADACSDFFNPGCGTDSSVSVTLYYWETCYANYLCGPAPEGSVPVDGYWACCDPPCNPTSDATGYYPLQLQVRWTSLDWRAYYQGKAPCNLFGPYEASWITLTLTSDTLTAPGGIAQRNMLWSSVCLGGGTFFGTAGSGVPSATYGSVSITLSLVCSSRFTAPAVTLSFNRWHLGGCVPDSANPGLDCATIGATDGLTYPLMCSPVDYTDTTSDIECSSASCEFEVDLREVSCEPTPPPP